MSLNVCLHLVTSLHPRGVFRDPLRETYTRVYPLQTNRECRPSDTYVTERTTERKMVPVLGPT